MTGRSVKASWRTARIGALVLVCLTIVGPRHARAQAAIDAPFKPRTNLSLSVGAFQGSATAMQEIYGYMPKVKIAVGYIPSRHLRLEGAIAGATKEGNPYTYSQGGSILGAKATLQLTELQATAQYLILGNGFMVYVGGGIAAISYKEKLEGSFEGESMSAEGSGTATGPVFVLGLEIPVGGKTSLYLQSSGTSATTSTQLGDVDFGGGTFEVGIRGTF